MDAVSYYHVPFWKRVNPFRKKYKAIFCISGGAGWCMAYWGALWFLRQQNVEPVGFVTRSAGGFIALSYAFDWSDEQARNYYKHFHLRDFFKSRLGFPLFDPQKYRKFTGQYSPDLKLEDLKVPVYMVSADLTDQRADYLHHDILVTEALTATTAIPGLIGPIEVQHKKYMDGEVVPGNDILFVKNNFGNYPVIQMDLGDDSKISYLVDRLSSLAKKTLHIAVDNKEFVQPDFELKITKVHGTPFSTDHVDENVTSGYETAKANWQLIKQTLESVS